MTPDSQKTRYLQKTKKMKFLIFFLFFFQYGLYSTFAGSFVYVFLGTVKEVSIGPTSLMALLTFEFTRDLPYEFIILLTFLAGCVEFLMGIMRLGKL